jgi:nicotinamide riboside kinase
MLPVLRVAVVGPESCGKTTLIAALAARLRSAGIAVAVADEYAREYYARRVYRPTPDDVLSIARGQLAAEARALRPETRVLLCDSTVLTCVIWSEVAFGAAAPELAGLSSPRDYGLTLLPRPDIAWQSDPLRSHPQARAMLLGRYRRALRTAGVSAVEVSGNGAARVEMAWDALRREVAGLPEF